MKKKERARRDKKCQETSHNSHFAHRRLGLRQMPGVWGQRVMSQSLRHAAHRRARRKVAGVGQNITPQKTEELSRANMENKNDLEEDM
jgi:hypothetical protein